MRFTLNHGALFASNTRMQFTRSILTLIFSVVSGAVWSQSIQGRLLEANTQLPVSNASVVAKNKRDTTLVFTTYSDSAGQFVLSVNRGFYELTLSKPGYETVISFEKVFETDVLKGDVFLVDLAKTTGEAKIIGNAAPVKQNGDTTEYAASAYKVNPDATASDLVKKMPGITVENGKIMAQGEEIKKVTLDGKEFFGSDAQTALNNLPAEVVDRIQVFQRMSDQAQFTGFDDGQSVRAINIKTRNGKATGVFGNVYGGVGTQQRYNSGAVYNNFKADRRITLLGMANDINIQNFSSQDLIGINSGGGGRMGGYRRSSPGDNFLTSQSGGISATQAAGFNYNDKWGEKATISASYFFNYIQNTQAQDVFRSYFNNNGAELGQSYTEKSETKSKPLNHRFTVRLEYNFDTSNSIIYTPSFSWQSSNLTQNISANNATTLSPINSSISQYINTGIGWNLKNELLFRHKFKKAGRTISLNLEHQYNAKKTTENNFSNTISFQPSDTFTTDQRIFSMSPTQSYGSRLSYTEQITAKGMIQFDYRVKVTTNDNDKSTYNPDLGNREYTRFDTLLSSNYNTQYTSHEPGVMLRHRGEKLMIGAGVGYQVGYLTGSQVFPTQTEVNKTFGNFLPRVFMNYKITKNANLRGMFRTNTNIPSVSQLQNVINTANPLIITTGNPNLRQEVARTLMLNYNRSNPVKLTNVYFGVSGAQTSDYITNVTHFIRQDTQLSEGFTALRGSQFSAPQNLAGYWNGKLFGNYGFPIKKIKTNANINGAYGIGKTPGIVNGLKNISNNQNFSGGAVLSSNINENIDFTVSYFGNYFVTKNSTQKNLDNSYLNQTATARVNYIFKTHWVISSDVNYNKYSGLSSGSFNQTFTLWNAGLGYKFMKNNAAELKFTCFDILKQNRSIARNIYSTYYEDNKTQVLTRYFMVNFSYKFRKFANGGKEPKPEEDTRHFGPPPGSQGPPGQERKPPYQP